ncbi:MAG: hypothetical protein NC132_05285 [Corallococcus sp.]|nr:hypothetical protein [Corallococcus sp.]MCM1359951.1 hypothetical protein [Corallococcus sp.]MCM1395507.1 hypothetical protein [Corallococcus sp.]
MSFIIAARDFLVDYDIFVLPAAFLAVWVFGIINFCKNTYRKQNKKIDACRRNLLKNNCQPAVVMCSAPEEYRRQWRAYAASGAERPSQTFEFVPRKNKKSGIVLVVLGAAVACVYAVIFAFDTSHREYAVFQAAFWLAFAIVLVVNRLVFKRKEKRARQTFGKFVAQLNAVATMQGGAVTAGVKPSDVARQIKKIKKGEVSKGALQQASQILRQNGLNGTRTAHEQRQINYALNGLLQAYSKNGTRIRT